MGTFYNGDLIWDEIVGGISHKARTLIDLITEGQELYNRWLNFRAGRTDAQIATYFTNKGRAIKGVGSGQAEEVCWLVAEIDGVRLYVNGSQMVLSKQDLMP